MFTSRAEFRLQLREDNADSRLTEIGRQLGLVDELRWDAFCRKRDAVSRETERLRGLWVSPKNLPSAESERVLGKAIEHEYSLAELLRRPGVRHADLMSLDGGRYGQGALAVSGGTAPELDPVLRAAVIEQVEIAAKYSGYIERQKGEVDRAAHFEHLRLPPGLDYLQVTALSYEVRQQLARHRPETLGQASRLSGITPAAMSLLLIHLKKNKVSGFAAAREAAQASPADRPLVA
jgi:tRNA uridine 5-carboxymethylaminomethyl modification enzyme